jgi:regulatory protein SWI5
MLSNPTTLHQRQRQHRRQNSTPTAFEAPKVPSLPTIQRNVAHRRGMSLDQRLRRQSPPQDIKQVSTTNKGFQQQQQQKILREAQQQRLARPGQQQQTDNFSLSNDENYLISPLVSPQRQSFDTGCHSLYEGSRGAPPSYSLDQVDTIIRVDPDNCSSNDPFGGNDTILFPENGNATSQAYLDFSMAFDELQDWGSTIKPRTRPSSRRVSGGIADRVAKFENMAAEQLDLRPVTPQAQNTGSKLTLDSCYLAIANACSLLPPNP